MKTTLRPLRRLSLETRIDFKKFIYLIVLFSYSFCKAGSYEDFFAAINKDDPAVVAALLQRGFDGNTRDPNGLSGLHLAVREKSLKVAAVLVGWNKISVETRTASDESPLMLASLAGLVDLSKALIAKGADVNKTGWTPLHYAASNGHVEVIKLLLENHAYIDAESPNGSTPLMMASMYGNPQSVKLLLDEGADSLLKNQTGLTALQFAQRGNRPDSAELLSKAMRSKQLTGTW